MNMKKGVLVLDFGSQYTQLIARRVRDLGIFSEIKPCFEPWTRDLCDSYSALILSGGPASVTAADAPAFDDRWLESGLPLLAICYGMQLLALHRGGKVHSGASREYGQAELRIVESSAVFSGFDRDEAVTVWMSHGDHVEQAPPGFAILGASAGAPVAAMGDEAKKEYGFQFHPEVVHSPRGGEMLRNFLYDVAGCERNWTSSGFIRSATERIRDQVGPDAQVICGLSGGVDSTVAAVLVNQAIGDRLHCIFVDNGLLRKHEAESVVESLGPKGLGLKLHKVDAAQRFLSELEGITDPEQKRKIIGRVFIEVFEEEARKIPGVTHLVQGTLYPDVIESVSVRGPSATIKTHHNVGGLPERMKLALIEPFRELFKDEVRVLGRELKIPDDLIWRQPFPGPGLAVRILGAINPGKLQILREADYIFQQEIKAAGLYRSIWQSFAVLLPVQSVGVMGDNRTYEQTIGLRAVYSEDGMTADWCYLPHDLLRRVSNRIINEVSGINRVVLDISSKPPATIEWE